MSEPGGVVDAQLRQLLKLVEERRDQRCGAVLDEAKREARGAVKEAFAAARRRVGEAVAEQRRQLGRALDEARARAAARLREAESRATLTLLKDGWGALEEALVRRWGSAEGEAEWCDALFQQAAARLPVGDWVVEHPPGWSSSASTHFASRLEDHLGHEASFEPDPALRAGLRIRCGGALLDASIAGLLADRGAIEALLLAELSRPGPHASGERP